MVAATTAGVLLALVWSIGTNDSGRRPSVATLSAGTVGSAEAVASDAAPRAVREAANTVTIVEAAVDSSTANHLLKVVRASALMGAHCVLTGLSESVAETLVDLGVDLSEVATLGSLRDGLRHCLKHIRSGTASE